MRDYKVELPLMSRTNPQKTRQCKVGTAQLVPRLGAALIALLSVLTLAGCGEFVKPTVSPQNAALNFFRFLSSGATDNAAAYWLPRQLTEANRAQLDTAAATLRPLKLRNIQAEVNPTPLPITPMPDSDMGASVALTVTAEVQATDSSWQAAQPMMKLQMTSTSIGWRVLNFTLTDMSTKR